MIRYIMINRKEIIMGRTGITYLDVSNAIASIQGKQKNPTVDTIREALGTGSRSTIAKYFQEWKTKNGVKNTTDTGIPTELQNLIQGLWEKVQSDAEKKIEVYCIEADEKINNVKNQLSQTQSQNTLLHTEITALTEKLNAQINTSDALTIKLHQAENEKIKCDERIISFETQNLNHKCENDRLHQLLKNTQNNLTHYQEAIEKQRSEQQMQLEKERADYALKLAVLEKQLIKIMEEKSVVETKYNLLADECQIQKNNLESREKENMQFQLKNNELMIENHHLNSQRETLQNKITDVTLSLKENEKFCHELMIQLAILKSENGALNKKSVSDENKIQLIQNDLNQLAQENASLKRTIKEATV